MYKQPKHKKTTNTQNQPKQTTQKKRLYPVKTLPVSSAIVTAPQLKSQGGGSTPT
jgi:hypothetical protein